MNANGARVAEGGPAAGEATVADLVMRARSGDQRAWDAIVERYAPLVWSICRRYRLSGADTDDAGQAVWLQLVDQIDRIRDPAALPGWLATTTRRECGRIVRAAHRAQPPGYVLDADYASGSDFRAAYGASGQQPGYNTALRTLSPVQGLNSQAALTPGSFGNPFLKPERVLGSPALRSGRAPKERLGAAAADGGRVGPTPDRGPV